MKRVKACEELKELTVLYVEDEENIRDSLSYILNRYVKKLYIAVNGEDGLEQYKKYKIDLVISDIKMPKLNGLEMSEKIKEIDESQHIVLTTAFGDIEYLKKAIEIGIDGYSIKPIERNQLFKKLNKIAKNIVANRKIEEYTELIKMILNEQKESILLIDSKLNIKFYNNSFQKDMCNNQCDSESVITLLKEYKIVEKMIPIDITWFENITDVKEDIVYKAEENSNKKLFYKISAKKVGSYIIFSSTDITDIQLQNMEYENKALTDQLTQVYNRHILEKEKNSFLNEHICMILLDIDDFKYINDTYGHPTGDKVLQILASTLKSHLRENDLIIRWGGEEFLIIIKETKNKDFIYSIAEKLRQIISYLKIDNHIKFTCSFGLACGYIDTQKDIESLIKQADNALYNAKQKGKNRVEQ